MRTRRADTGLGPLFPSAVEIEQAVPSEPALRFELGKNEEQLQVIRHEGGPLCVLAAAGSGKTSALVSRVARLVEHVGVAPDRILCVTFSTKAAGEMNERIKALGIAGVEVRTWHAFCRRVIRETPTREARWETDDKDKAKTYVKQAIGYKHENWVGADTTKIRNFIGRCKANLWAPGDPEALVLAKTIFGGQASRVIRVYAISQGFIEDAGLLTFDDMLVIAARLFTTDEEARQSWAGKFDYVLTDECQDNSRAQDVLQDALARDHRNIMVVGDLAQCHPPGVMVEVSRSFHAGRAGIRGEDKSVPIESLRDGDTVMGWNRNAQRMISGRRVKVATRPYSGTIHTMRVAGREVPMTPSHRVLARWTDRARDHYLCVTYLMWRKEFGFRVGWCQVFASSGTYGVDTQCIVLHMAQRARIERAEKFWVLKVHQTRTQASVYESIIAAKYGIPTVTFEPVDGAQHLTSESIAEIFGAAREGRGLMVCDTNDWRGRQALADHGSLHFDLPLYPWPGKTRDEIDLRQGRMTYFEVYASNLIPELMSVPLPDATNEWATIESVSAQDYVGPVYSLDVEEDHSYAANGVVVLNSLYSFRGAIPELLAGFSEKWGAPVVTMHRNYRSGSAIIAAANEVIRESVYKLPVDMVASRPNAGEGKVEILACDTLEDEANELVSAAQTHLASGGKLSDFMVLVRLNAQSRALEDALLRARIPYVILGGVSFYERNEVKDLLGYLRVALGRDPARESVKRCINAPFRFLGARFVERLMDVLPETYGLQDLGQCLRETVRRENIQSRQIVSANDWLRIVEDCGSMAECVDGEGKQVHNAAAILEEVVRRTRYIDWLEKEEGEESVESSHAANVRELLRVAREFRTAAELLDYIEKIIKEGAAQRKKQSGDLLTIMSCHKSKGGESPIVWLCGCNEGVLPHAKGDIEEERRIMYVAVTRARDRLVVSYVGEMATRSGVRSMAPSRFLEAFPKSKANAAHEESPAQTVEDFEGVVTAEEAVEILDDVIARVDPVQVYGERDPGPARLAWLGTDATCDRCGSPVGGCVC
jgi:superfamily I DNA/RNA helicase